MANARIRRFEIRSTPVVIRDVWGTYNRSIGGSGDIAALARPLIEDLEQESLIVFHLDAKHRVRGFHEASRGTATATLVDPSTVLRAPLLNGAVAIAMSHNHPSGFSEPSRADAVITERVLKASEFFGIRFLDHVIVAPDATPYSFYDEGLLRHWHTDAEQEARVA